MARKLIVVPIVHPAADLGSQLHRVKRAHIERQGLAGWRERRAAVERLWQRIRERVLALPLDYSKVKLYQDGLPVCGFELDIVQDLAVGGSSNHQLLLDLVELGARLIGTEDPRLLIEERERILRGPADGGTESRRPTELYDDLLEQRDAYIARTIAATLRPGELGLLFIGALHRVDGRLLADVEVEHLDVGLER